MYPVLPHCQVRRVQSGRVILPYYWGQVWARRRCWVWCPLAEALNFTNQRWNSEGPADFRKVLVAWLSLTRRSRLLRMLRLERTVSPESSTGVACRRQRVSTWQGRWGISIQRKSSAPSLKSGFCKWCTHQRFFGQSAVGLAPNVVRALGSMFSCCKNVSGTHDQPFRSSFLTPLFYMAIPNWAVQICCLATESIIVTLTENRLKSQVLEHAWTVLHLFS